MRQRLNELSEQLAKLTPEIEEHKSCLGIVGGVDLADVERLTDEADDRIEQIGERLRLSGSVAESAVELVRAQEELTTWDKEVAARTEILASTNEQWQQHARSLHLPVDTSPRTAGLVFAKAEKARNEKQQLENLACRIDEMQAARSDYLAVMAVVPSLKKVLDEKAEEILATLTTFLAEMEQQEERLLELKHARVALKSAAARTVTANQKLEQAESALAEAKESQDAAEVAWEEWLESHGMDAGWSPDTSEHALGRVIRLVEISGDRKAAESDLARLRSDVADYRSRATAVLDAVGRSVSKGCNLSVEIRRAEEDRAKHDTQRTLHTQLAADVCESESRCETRRTRINNAEDEVTRLLETGGAKDEDEFRRRGRAHQNLQDLSATIASCESAIRKLSGKSNLEATKGELAGENRDQLMVEEVELKRRIEEVEGRRAEELEQRGAAERHQQILYSEDLVAQLRAKEEGLLEDIAVQARDWARYAVADHLITAAKERHAQAN